MPRGLGPRGFLTDEEKKNKPKVTKFLLLALVTLAASQVIGVLESYINAWISQRIIFDMKNQMYDHLQHIPHAFFTSEKQGDIITRMNTDISGVSTVISGTLSSMLDYRIHGHGVQIPRLFLPCQPFLIGQIHPNRTERSGNQDG